MKTFKWSIPNIKHGKPLLKEKTREERFQADLDEIKQRIKNGWSLYFITLVIAAVILLRKIEVSPYLMLPIALAFGGYGIWVTKWRKKDIEDRLNTPNKRVDSTPES